LTKNVNSSLRRSINTESSQTSSSSSTGNGNLLLAITAIAAGAGGLYFSLKQSGFGKGVAANTIMDDGLHPAAHPWPNTHPFATFDHAR
jgi:ubiquinol-cytochrome c reductase cytochrome c1 subunit